MEREIFTTQQTSTYIPEIGTHTLHARRQIAETLRQQNLAEIRHHLAEHAEQGAHALTAITTAANLAIESPQLKAAEIVVATTGLTLTFLHALHHKYKLQQEEKGSNQKKSTLGYSRIEHLNAPFSNPAWGLRAIGTLLSPYGA